MGQKTISIPLTKVRFQISSLSGQFTNSFPLLLYKFIFSSPHDIQYIDTSRNIEGQRIMLLENKKHFINIFITILSLLRNFWLSEDMSQHNIIANSIYCLERKRKGGGEGREIGGRVQTTQYIRTQLILHSESSYYVVFVSTHMAWTSPSADVQ